jgi:hypothetical protein
VVFIAEEHCHIVRHLSESTNFRWYSDAEHRAEYQTSWFVEVYLYVHSAAIFTFFEFAKHFVVNEIYKDGKYQLTESTETTAYFGLWCGNYLWLRCIRFLSSLPFILESPDPLT